MSKKITQQGDSLREIFDQVRQAVIDDTSNKDGVTLQIPWYRTAMEKPFYPAGRGRTTSERVF